MTNIFNLIWINPLDQTTKYIFYTDILIHACCTVHSALLAAGMLVAALLLHAIAHACRGPCSSYFIAACNLGLEACNNCYMLLAMVHTMVPTARLRNRSIY